MRLVTCALALIALSLPRLSQAVATIELQATDGSCRLDASAGVDTLTIVALNTVDATCCEGFTGAELRVEGMPVSWAPLVVPAPTAAVVIGNPFAEGANIAFSNTLHADRIVLFTVMLHVPEDASATLHVTMRNPPSNPDFSCPLVVGGGYCPCWATACADGGVFFINTPGNCLVPVTRVTWSQMKRLYN
jgi:hypothetical protein